MLLGGACQRKQAVELGRCMGGGTQGRQGVPQHVHHVDQHAPLVSLVVTTTTTTTRWCGAPKSTHLYVAHVAKHVTILRIEGPGGVAGVKPRLPPLHHALKGQLVVAQRGSHRARERGALEAHGKAQLRHVEAGPELLVTLGAQVPGDALQLGRHHLQ